MLYTIIPYEEVFDEGDQILSSREISVGGIFMQVQPGDNNSGQIARIISTDPQDYLNPNYQPGTMISLG